MFASKHKVPILCDSYIDLYSNCNINCDHCKFQINRDCEIKVNDINFEDYKDKKVLFCYSVDPYPYGQETSNLVETVIQRLHKQNCSIVFLTRRAECLFEDLDNFNRNDFAGVSLSENCRRNSDEQVVMEMYKKAKLLGINTWMSLEPIHTYEYANYIIDKYYDVVDFIRIGKNDLMEYDWDIIKKNIIVNNNKKVFIKQ